MFFTIIEDDNVEEDLTKEEFQSLLYEAKRNGSRARRTIKRRKQLKEENN